MRPSVLVATVLVSFGGTAFAQSPDDAMSVSCRAAIAQNPRPADPAPFRFGSMRNGPDGLLLIGGVVITFNQAVLCADTVDVQSARDAVVAIGNVMIIDSNKNTTRAERVAFEPTAARAIINAIGAHPRP